MSRKLCRFMGIIYLDRKQAELYLNTHLLPCFCVQDEDTVEDVCKQIIKRWTEYCSQSAARRDGDDGIYLLLLFSFDSSTHPVKLKWEIFFIVADIWPNPLNHPQTALNRQNETLSQRK